MKNFPTVPQVADAPAVLDSGHLWLLELVDGAPLRFQLQESGLIRFGDRERTFSPDAVPDPYGHAVRHVREHLDRDALRRAVDDVSDAVFFGVATHRQTIDYDWARTPSFLGYDVWSRNSGKFRPPDTTAQIFDHLGLHPVNAIERERRARDFDPGTYTIPDSAWYDGPAAGVVICDKQGGRAKLLHADFECGETTEPAPLPQDTSAGDLAAEYATPRRFERLADDLDSLGRPVTFDALYERALEDIERELHQYLQDTTIDVEAFRSEVAAATRAFLDEKHN